jgi:hypothetical protein
VAFLQRQLEDRLVQLESHQTAEHQLGTTFRERHETLEARCMKWLSRNQRLYHKARVQKHCPRPLQRSVFERQDAARRSRPTSGPRHYFPRTERVKLMLVLALTTEPAARTFFARVAALADTYFPVRFDFT